ncbi:hypothetical protein Plhal304r1_c047g0129031 [Plasmopara halstedii]
MRQLPWTSLPCIFTLSLFHSLTHSLTPVWVRRSASTRRHHLSLTVLNRTISLALLRAQPPVPLSGAAGNIESAE